MIQRRKPLRSTPKARTTRTPSGPAIRGYAPPAEPIRTTTAPRNQGDAIEKPLRLRSRSYLDSVKADPCEAAGDPLYLADCAGPIDPHHVKARGRRGDDFDLTAIPLCRKHHDDAHDGAISIEEQRQMLGAYLVRKLPRLTRSEARAMLGELLAGID